MNNNYRNAYEMNNYINDNDLKRIFNGYIIYWSSRYGVDSTVRQIQAFLGDTYNKGNVRLWPTWSLYSWQVLPLVAPP